MEKAARKHSLPVPGRVKPAFVHAAAFLLPLLGLALTFAAVGVFPFGPKSTLTLDMKSQYVTFLAYLRDQVWLGGGDLLYTFSKALGGDMAGFSAYYLLSPFNLLLLLVPTAHLPVGITLATLLKVGLCGLAMSLLLCEKTARLESLLFSIPYALMDFIVAFHFNIMWLDGVILLPLVVLGLRRLYAGKSPLLYALCLAAAIVTNYYIGYMICIFSLLYFVVMAVFWGKVPADARMNPGALRPLIRFAGASAIGVGLSAAVLFPAVFSLVGGKAGFTFESFLDKSYATLADVASRYMPGTASPAQVFFGYPAIYCGMLALLCTVLYFLNRSVPRRARLGSGLLLAVLLLSFCVGPLDRVWHAFNKPVGFLFRYSFLLSFMLLHLGWQGFLRLRGRLALQKTPLVLVAALVVAMLAHRETHDFLTTGKLILGFGLLLAFSALLWLINKRKWRYGLLFLLAFVLFDMGASAYISLRHADYPPLADFAGYVNNEKPIVEAIKSREDSFFRMEKDYSYSDNDALLLGYNGLSHFSSADKMFVRSFLDAMGFSDGGYGVKYADGSTVYIESLLGMKALVTGAGGTMKPYDLTEEMNGRMLWQTPLALPLGFLAGPGVAAPLPEGANPFEKYNAMAKMIDPALQEDLYRPAAAETVLVDITAREIEGETLYEKLADGGRVEFQILVESSDMLYAYFTTNNERNIELFVNSSSDGQFLYNDRHGVLPLGRFAPGQTVTLSLAPYAWEAFVKDAFFVYEDAALLAQTLARLQEGAYQPPSNSSSYFDGAVRNTGDERDTLLLSIPYDAGWQATLDGEKIALQPAFGALTCLSVPKGQHQLALRYVPPGLWAGVAVSACSLLCLLAWCLQRQRAKKKPHGAEQPPQAEASAD